jgi:hypothetical protein
MTRNEVLTNSAALAAVARQPKAKPTSAPPARVTQAELQAVIDAQNHVEVLAADIRRRLEAGAEFERGPLGACAWDRDPLKDLRIGDATQCDGFGILDIRPAEEHIKFRDEVSREHPCFADEIAAVTWA